MFISSSLGIMRCRNKDLTAVLSPSPPHQIANEELHRQVPSKRRLWKGKTASLIHPTYGKVFRRKRYKRDHQHLGIHHTSTMAISRDRISNLSDPILQSILSLVPLKSAIRTSILSKRWRHLWEYNLSSATSLDFGKEFARRQSRKKFVVTIDRYLQLHDSKKLESLRIVFFPSNICLPSLERWITFAAMKGVEQLDLDLFKEYLVPRDGRYISPRKLILARKGQLKSIKLPSSLFDCVSLVHLSLSCCKFRSPLEFKRLSCLRSLCLNDVNISDEVLHSVLADCTLLQSLSLRNCHFLEYVSISGPKLRVETLTVAECEGLLSLQISAPRLQSLHQFGRIYYRCPITSVPSLVDALVSSVGREPFGYYTMILSDLAHVKILTVCTSTLGDVDRAERYNPHAFPILLQNLQELQLLIDIMGEGTLSCLFSFFQLCPSPILEKLFIRLPRYIEDHPDFDSELNDFKKPPDVIFNNLKVIKVNNFRVTISELSLLKFLLQKAVVLQSLVIVAPPTDRKEETDAEHIGSSSQRKPNERVGLRIFHGQLSVLPKASSNCHIVVCDYLDNDTGLNPLHTQVYCEHNFFAGCAPCVCDYFVPEENASLMNQRG